MAAARVSTAVAVVAAACFVGLTILVRAGLTAGVDLSTTLTFQQADQAWIGALMGTISAPGYMPLGLYLVAGAAATFFLAGWRLESLFVLLAGASWVVTELIKPVVERPRPGPGAVRVFEGVGGFGFPSGHTLFYVTFFGFIAYAAYALLEPGKLRTATLLTCAILVLLVGPSRIWLGHHWLSDVLAAYALGLTLLIILIRFHGALRSRRKAGRRDGPLNNS